MNIMENTGNLCCGRRCAPPIFAAIGAAAALLTPSIFYTKCNGLAGSQPAPWQPIWGRAPTPTTAKVTGISMMVSSFSFFKRMRLTLPSLSVLLFGKCFFAL